MYDAFTVLSIQVHLKLLQLSPSGYSFCTFVEEKLDVVDVTYFKLNKNNLLIEIMSF